MTFKGQSAVVVGGSRGFGRGVVERLIASGMTVTAVARNARDLEALAPRDLGQNHRRRRNRRTRERTNPVRDETEFARSKRRYFFGS